MSVKRCALLLVVVCPLALASSAFVGGYLGVPLVTHVEGTGTISAFAGLGYGFLEWMGLEVRGRWTRYFKMPPGAPNHTWSIEAGFSFSIN